MVDYTDTDWASQDHKHSISGYIYQIDGGSISWSCQKQSIVALSPTKAEFIALTHTFKEALWLQHIIAEVFQLLEPLVQVNFDNQSAIAIAYGNRQHARMKHFNIRLYFIRDTIEDNKISIKYLPTEQMVADIFTRALPGPRMKILTQKNWHILGLRGCVEAYMHKVNSIIFQSFLSFHSCITFISLFAYHF